MRKRILIVDDDNIVRRLYEMQIGMKDHEVQVTSAADGEEAIRSIDASQPDLLMLDLRLPKADGFAVLKHLHDNAYVFPVVIVTNYDNDEYRTRCEEYEIVHEYFLKRAVAIDELMVRLKFHLYGA
jgi:DNA-binding response OmpR family regulator